ncbi:MAG TPA: HDOD domain-containing protein [Opitutales bacterium]|nr:HDOD domain-containing protein [Opitutales bacterium]
MPNEPSSPTLTPFELTRKALMKALEYDELRIPVLPQVAHEILALTRDPDSDLSDLSSLIYQDQSIASRVLHISNSAAFAGMERIDSLDMAVSRLGMRLLSEIALSVSIEKNIFDIPEYRTEVKWLWQHALASALFAKEIGDILRLNGEGLYICGLLHAIGKPVTLLALKDLPSEIRSGLTKEEAFLLVEEFSISVGTIVTRQWKLPQVIQDTNFFYRDYEQALRHKTETMVTYLADILATHAISPERLSDEEILQDAVIEKLGLSSDSIVEILEFREHVRQRTRSMDI